MQSSSRQYITGTIDGNHHDRQEASPRIRHPVSSAERYQPQNVHCQLLANSNVGLHADVLAQLRSVTNSIGVSASEAGTPEMELGLIPLGFDNQRSEVLAATAASHALPVVLVADDLASARRRALLPNVIDIVANDQSGGERLAALKDAIGANVHQKIWLVGEIDNYTRALYQNLGYQVECVSHLNEVDHADECANLRGCSTVVLLNSCGPRCYHDIDNLPVNLERAAQGNEYFSMFVLLDADSTELAPLWQQRSITPLDTRYVSDHETKARVQQALQVQHRVVTLAHDAVRNPATGIYNNNYLEDCGRRLHAAAQRGGSAFSVVVLQPRSIESLSDVGNKEVFRLIHQVLENELRESDVIAQRFPQELVCLVTSTGRYALSGFLERVLEIIQTDVAEQFGPACSLGVGATSEPGAGFESMLHRATMAALQCNLPDSDLVVIL